MKFKVRFNSKPPKEAKEIDTSCSEEASKIFAKKYCLLDELYSKKTIG